jgi:hypothetical protein
MTTNIFSPLSFVAVFGSGIRDSGSEIRDPGSGINIPDPPHWYGAHYALGYSDFDVFKENERVSRVYRWKN